ncbi:nucleotide exchange factor GrpE [Candidatus Gottesmanbacteria bacterium]|nr:nucleotide exchange factor GrpE [Candidatus Gottesmanbacteria bacterium]
MKQQKQPTDDQEVKVDESEEWKGKYLRALADYQNLEKRTYQEAQITRKYANEFLLTRLLSVSDTFERALDHLKDQGLGLAVKELRSVFSEHGVTKMEVIGKPFDPMTMECIDVVDGQEGIVIEEVAPGYLLYDKVIRVAKVNVGKKVNQPAGDQI